MLRSRKSKAPGPKEFAVTFDICACGCEVYKSFRAQAGMKDEGCIAANGEDASIVNGMGAGIEIILSIESMQQKSTAGKTR